MLATEIPLEDLAASTDPRERAMAAGDPRLPPALFASLAGDPDAAVMVHLAANPSIPAPLARSLAGRGLGPRTALAANEGAPAAVLAELCQREDHPDVLTALTRRAGLPLEATRALVRRSDPAGRAVAAHRGDTPSQLLADLCGDPDAAVRLALATNPATPADALAELARAERDEPVLASLCVLPHAPRPVLEALAASPSVAARRAIAARRDAPPALLSRLAHDPDPSVCLAVAGNPSAPREALSTLTATPVPSVMRAAQAHPGYAAVQASQRRQQLFAGLAVGAVAALVAVAVVVVLFVWVL